MASYWLSHFFPYPLLFHSLCLYYPLGLIINCTIIVINQVERLWTVHHCSLFNLSFKTHKPLLIFSQFLIFLSFLIAFLSSFWSLSQWACTPPSSVCCSCFAWWLLPWLVRLWTGNWRTVMTARKKRIPAASESSLSCLHALTPFHTDTIVMFSYQCDE